MPVTHVVQQGDCLSSIAEQYGFYDCQTIWQAPDNAALRQARESPNVLLPGDEVVIPDKDAKPHTCATGQRHKFTIKARKTKVRIALKPKRTVAYRLVVDGDVLEGTTDGSSPLELAVSRTATTGKLLAWPESMPADQRTEDNADVWQLALGGLDPHDAVSGAQSRLQNLHYYAGPVDGVVSDAMGAALRAFQKDQGLETSGELDDATRSALKSAHDGG